MREQPTYNDNVELFRIARAVAFVFKVSIEDMKAKTRIKKIVNARQYYFYITRNYTELSYGKIGGYLKRDHATALYGHNKIKDQLAIYPDVQERIDETLNYIVRKENDRTVIALLSLEKALTLYNQFLEI